MEQNQEQLKKEAADAAQTWFFGGKKVPECTTRTDDYEAGFLAGAERAAKEKEQIEPVLYYSETGTIYSVEEWNATDDEMREWRKRHFEVRPLYSHPPASAAPQKEQVSFEKLAATMQEAIYEGLLGRLPNSRVQKELSESCARVAVSAFGNSSVSPVPSLDRDKLIEEGKTGFEEGSELIQSWIKETFPRP